MVLSVARVAFCRLTVLHSKNTVTFNISRSLRTTVQPNDADPNFGDHRLIFQEHSMSELCRALFVLQTCSIEPLVRNSQKLMKVGHSVLGDRALAALVYPYYWQFVAGDSVESLNSVCQQLSKRRVKLMVGPTLESDLSDNDSDSVYSANLRKMVWFIRLSAQQGKPMDAQCPPICQAEVTGHCSPIILEKISAVYEKMNIEERLKAVQWVSDVMATTKGIEYPDLTSFMENNKGASGVPVGPFQLTKEEQLHLVEAMRRMYLYGKLAVREDIVLAIDAEFTYTNPAIYLVTMAMMNRLNKKKPVIWGTYQAYLKSSKTWLSDDRELAEKLNICFGFKVVRGAYIEHEKLHAQVNNLTDPVQDSYDSTSRNYNSIIKEEMALVHECPSQRALLVASHNEESAKLALRQLSQMASPLPSHYRHHCSFGQQYGMAENISVPLAAAGAVVYKSVPVGSVGDVLPYLARRAIENRSVLAGARREKGLLLKEIVRRMKK